jgi:lysophospholipase L1-like esterase
MDAKSTAPLVTGPGLLVFRVAAAAISLALSLLIGEVIVSATRPQEVVFFFRDEVDGLTSARPNSSGRHVVPSTFDVTVSFSSQRFRGQREFTLQPAPGVLRIAALGDSSSFGFGANDEETYPAQLEHILNDQSDRVRTEVINAANGGTGTGEQALWYADYVNDFKPQLVVLGVTFTDVDDDLINQLFYMDPSGGIYPRNRRKTASYRDTLRAIPGYFFLSERSQLFNLFRREVTDLATQIKASSGADTQGGHRSMAERFMNDGLGMTSAEIGWLYERIREGGAHLVVAFIPARETIYSSEQPWAEDVRWKSAALLPLVRESCASRGIPFIDLTQFMRDQAQPRPLYYDGLDTHPNPRGYRAIAEGIAEFLIRQDWSSQPGQSPLTLWQLAQP